MRNPLTDAESEESFFYRFAEYYSRSQSMMQGRRLEAALAGGRPVGSLPEGYAVSQRGYGGKPIAWQPSKPLSDIIVAGGHLRLGGATYRDLAAWGKTTALAGRTPKGSAMTAAWWRRTLRNPRYAGLQRATPYLGYRGDVGNDARRSARNAAPLVPCHLPPLFTREEQERMA